MAIRILLSRKLGELRMSQAELSRRTGIRAATICEIYNEMCERINLEHIDRICTVLNCDLNEILVYEAPKNREEALELYKQG